MKIKCGHQSIDSTVASQPDMVNGFLHDGLFQGKTFRAFNVIDDFNREVLTIAIDMSLTSERVIRELDKLIEWRAKPECLRLDNGPEFIPKRFRAGRNTMVSSSFLSRKVSLTKNNYIIVIFLLYFRRRSHDALQCLQRSMCLSSASDSRPP